MSKQKQNIDDLLFNQLHESAMDAEGIDWASFNTKRKKKRGLIWFYYTLALVIISSGVALFNIWGSKINIKHSNIRTQNNRTNETSGSEWEDKKSETFKPHDLNTETELSNELNKTKIVLPKPDLFQAQMLIKRPDTKITSNQNNLETYVPIEREVFMIKPKSKIKLKYNLDFIPIVNKISEIPYKPNFSKEIKQSLFFDIQVGQGVNNPVFKVTSLGQSFIHKDYEAIRKSSEVAISGFNFQVAVGKKIKRWNYSLGLGIINTRIQGNYNYTYSDKPVIDLDGSIKSYLKEIPSQIKYSSKQSITFIEVPIATQYNWIERGKLSSGIRLGYYTQFLSSINGQLPNPLYLDQREKLSTENYKTRTSSVQLAIPLLYQLNKKSSLILIPEFRRGFGFNQIQNYYKTDFNYWGLNINYRIKF